MNRPGGIDILRIPNPVNFVALPQPLNRLIRLEMYSPLTTCRWRKTIADLPSNDPPLVMLIVAQCSLKP
jgi:hypothetical protein